MIFIGSFRTVACLFCLVFCLRSGIALSEVGLVSSYPKSLSLDFVMSLALNQSQTFKTLREQKKETEGPRLLALAPFEMQLHAATSLFETKTEAVSPLNPLQTTGQQSSVAVSKYFSTGTNLSTKFLHNFSRAEFDPAILFPAGASSIEGYDSQLSLQLSQNLWKDAFGEASRLGLRIGEKAANLSALAIQQQMESTALQLIRTYYLAWFAQAKVKSAREDFARRKRLLNNTLRRAQLGTAERPDVLQIRSSLILTENLLNTSLTDLQDRWRELIVILDLPDELLSYDPENIPMEVGNLPTSPQAVCAELDTRKSLEVQQSHLQKEVSELSLKKADSDSEPELQLRGELANNEIDTDRTKSLSGASQGHHPSWRVELALTLPLGSSFREGRLQTARSEALAAELRHSQVQDQVRVGLINGCKNVNRLMSLRNNLNELEQGQSERSRLEEQRFRLGRATLFAVIQADDEASQAKLLQSSTEAELRISLWQLIKTQAQFDKYFSQWMDVTHE